MSKIDGLLNLSRYCLSFLNFDVLKAGRPASPKTGSNVTHIEAAVQWLCRAQDTNKDDGGVSRSYSLIYHPYFQKKGWVGSYPETTGYIIPTMFDYARISGNQDLVNRAVRMADWECEVQLANGAVQGGTVDQKPSPAVFNTGQVIFGWLSAYRETGDEKYLDAARKAGDFLVSIQAEDGSWRSNLSDYAGGSNMEYYAYNSRTAWALLALAEVDDPQGNLREAGIANINFALKQQLDNGWFVSNCLNKPAEPLVHTIAYCIRGILEAGILLGRQDYIDRAATGADALARIQRKDGSLAGRYDNNWQATVEWSCLTGNAQTSIIWAKLYRLTKEEKYLHCLHKINNYLKSVQLITIGNRDIYGGICGSHPIGGQYGRYEILNWAVKFFIDALLMEELIEGKIDQTLYNGPQS